MLLNEGQCGDQCGWIAAAVSCLAFGSFAVPIKGDAANSVNIDPLVFQSYKTIMCFLTSWLVLLSGQEFSFSPWGIVSGLFWVPAAVGAVYSVRNAGLAVAQGTWSALIALVSFSWGIFIFDEKVKSRGGAVLGISLMVMGLWGMSYFSSPSLQPPIDEYSNEALLPGMSGSDVDGYSKLNMEGRDEMGNTETIQQGTRVEEFDIPLDENDIAIPSRPKGLDPMEVINIYGYKVTRRKLGLYAAIFNGIWGGSVLVPMHFSSDKTEGLGFVISFGIGAGIITTALWVMRYLFCFCRTKSLRAAFESLPSFHLRIMWLPGGFAGALWSLGNICSMVSVQYLGEGIGYSVVQGAMLVSGLWGIFWFKEVRGFWKMAQWFLSALVTLGGILLLSYQHQDTP